MSGLKEFTASVDKLIKVLPSLPKKSSSSATTELGRLLSETTKPSVAVLASIKIVKNDLYEERMSSLAATMRFLAKKKTTSDSDLESLCNLIERAMRLFPTDDDEQEATRGAYNKGKGKKKKGDDDEGKEENEKEEDEEEEEDDTKSKSKERRATDAIRPALEASPVQRAAKKARLSLLRMDDESDEDERDPDQERMMEEEEEMKGVVEFEFDLGDLKKLKTADEFRLRGKPSLGQWFTVGTSTKQAEDKPSDRKPHRDPLTEKSRNKKSSTLSLQGNGDKSVGSHSKGSIAGPSRASTLRAKPSSSAATAKPVPAHTVKSSNLVGGKSIFTADDSDDE